MPSRKAKSRFAQKTFAISPYRGALTRFGELPIGTSPYNGFAAIETAQSPAIIANTTFVLRLNFREKKNLKNFPLSKKKK